ncbi:hypothetical protein DACRYDRAFT_21364 [Dacryopinax primogenitus]|uniref:Uncharacterized protein n=1 Tax=Dacryopinax primogenitus (strain DJM 731) TaxID=1858805 RepID=M5G2S7_DACPD|nr:uncharacterized protein DACRYDRAFT_21364 [Dacryopinax primogenitus]EJU02999.1 hypothetical protein DACRYDRAFT_21364 [Dacryopinax primogenitus]
MLLAASILREDIPAAYGLLLLGFLSAEILCIPSLSYLRRIENVDIFSLRCTRTPVGWYSQRSFGHPFWSTSSFSRYKCKSSFLSTFGRYHGIKPSVPTSAPWTSAYLQT